MATKKNYVPRRLGLIAQIIVYLLPGVVIFLFLPSLLFSYFEDWPYTVSIYYSFVTLTTIGFGDYVPTFNPQQVTFESIDIGDNFDSINYLGIFVHHFIGRQLRVPVPRLWSVYYFLVYLWPGLSSHGYGIYSQVSPFCQINRLGKLWFTHNINCIFCRGLQSKHITRIEHQLAENIKSTQNRIWNGVTKDVSYLRRILNEVYMMKFKVHNALFDAFCNNPIQF